MTQPEPAVGKVTLRIEVGARVFVAWPAGTGLAVGLDSMRLGAEIERLGVKRPLDAVLAEMSAAEGWTSPQVGKGYRLVADDAVAAAITCGGTKVARLVTEIIHGFADAEQLAQEFVAGLCAASAPTPAAASGGAPGPRRVGAPGKEEFLAALDTQDYHMGRTAEALGLPRRTFYRYMSIYQIPFKREARRTGASSLPAASKDKPRR